MEGINVKPRESINTINITEYQLCQKSTLKDTFDLSKLENMYS